MPKRILFISHSGGISGGAELSLLELLGRINKKKYEPIVLVPREGPFQSRLREIGIEDFILDIPWWFSDSKSRSYYVRNFLKTMPKRVSRIRKILRDRRIGLVYTNTIACIDGGVAAKLENIPHVWHIREILKGNTALRSFLPISWNWRTVDLLSERIIVPSNAARGQFVGRNNGRKIVIVEDGIDLELFPMRRHVPRRNYREELKIDPKDRVIGMVGYFHEIKGQEVFIEAAGILSARDKDTTFIIAGNGFGNNPYSRRLTKMVSELGLEGRLHFLEFQDEIADLMDTFDIYICASWVESFSRVVCEAMASGKPVVATRCGGPEEIVVDGETGYPVPVRNPEEMARAIRELLIDQRKARQMGDSGRRRVEERFTIERYVRDIEDLLDQIT